MIRIVKIRPNGHSLCATIPADIIRELNLDINDQLAVSYDKESKSFTMKYINQDELVEEIKNG